MIEYIEGIGQPWIMGEIRIVYNRMAKGFFVALTMTAIFLAGCAPQTNTVTTSPARQSSPTPIPTLSWHQVMPPNGISFKEATVAVSPVDGHTAWACAPASTSADSFTIWATKDAGASWQQVSTLTPVTLEPPRSCNLVADQYDPQSVMVMASWGAGADGTLRTVSNLSSDGGAHWHQLQGKVQTTALGTIGGKIYASLFDTTNRAGAPQLATISSAGDPLQWRVISPTSLAANDGIVTFWKHTPSEALFAASYQGTFWRSADGGTTWKRISASTGQVRLGTWLPQQSHWLFCASTDVHLDCSTDDGASWHPLPALDAAPQCPVSALLPDGSALASCLAGSSDTGASSFTLYRLVPGASSWGVAGTAPSAFITVTATGQMWAINAQMGTISVADMPL